MKTYLLSKPVQQRVAQSLTVILERKLQQAKMMKEEDGWVAEGARARKPCTLC